MADFGNIDARHRGADWPIFLNEHGYVAESSGAAIGLFKGGTFHTPDVGSGILESVTGIQSWTCCGSS